MITIENHIKKINMINFMKGEMLTCIAFAIIFMVSSMYGVFGTGFGCFLVVLAVGLGFMININTKELRREEIYLLRNKKSMIY